MNRIVVRSLTASVKRLTVQTRQVSGVTGMDMYTNPVAHHRDRASAAPLLEHYRSSWPDVSPDRPVSTVLEIPERTVPDDVLNFQFTARFTSGSEFFHPHLKTNPADFKCILKVFLADLPLNKQEKQIFVRMIGKRIKVGNGEVKLTCNKFPNRLENRKYLLFLLEKLLKEAKHLNTLRDQYREVAV